MSQSAAQPKIHIIDVGPGHAGLLSLLAAQDKTGRTVAIDIESWGPGFALNPFAMTEEFLDADANDETPFSRSKVRKYLARHGLRGARLKSEVDRITRGYAQHLLDGHAPVRDKGLLQMRYPYGWPKSAMTRLMRRMFHGHGKPHLGHDWGDFMQAFDKPHRSTYQ